jgi:hypothetical protein
MKTASSILCVRKLHNLHKKKVIYITKKYEVEHNKCTRGFCLRLSHMIMRLNYDVKREGNSVPYGAGKTVPPARLLTHAS